MFLALTLEVVWDGGSHAFDTQVWPHFDTRIGPAGLAAFICVNNVVTLEGVEEQEFDWDESNIRHLARHDVSPLEAEQAMLDPDAVVLEIQNEEEDRLKTVGRTAGGRILVTIFAFRGEAIRPITAYDATMRDQKVYLKTGSL